MPLNGDIVVVDIDGERSFKIWRGRQGRVTLSFANARSNGCAGQEECG
jgi:DNA polymerase V